MSIFIYPDRYSQVDNGNILAGYGYAKNEDLGSITSSYDTYDNLGLITTSAPEIPSTDSYGLITSRPVYYWDYGTLIDPVLKIQILDGTEDYGDLYLTDVVDFGRVVLESNPPSKLSYRTDKVDVSEDYGILQSRLTETENFGLIVETVTEVDPYGLISTPIYSYGTTSKTTRYSEDSILYPQSPDDYELISSVSSENIDYGLLQNPYNEILNYGQVIYGYNETVYPYGKFVISGVAKERFTPATAVGSGTISASGLQGESITDFYGINSVGINTYIESLLNYGSVFPNYVDYGSVSYPFPANQYTDYGSVSVALPANEYTDYGSISGQGTIDEIEDYGLIISSVTEVDSYGFLYSLITPFGLFNVSGSAEQSFKPAFAGSGFITPTGILEEENTDSYNLGSILLGDSSENYGTVNTSATESDSYGLLSAPVDQAEDYHYVFYTAGETVYPYGTIQVSGASFNELKIRFTQEGSGSITANGVSGEAITKFYGVDSDSIDTFVEFSTSYGIISDSVDNTEDYGLIISSVTEVDLYGFLYPRIIPFGLFNVSGSAGNRFSPASYIASGSIDNSGVLEEKNTDSYNLGSILPGSEAEDYGTVNTSATESDSYGLITAPVDQVENYDYIFYTAGETVYPFGTIQISGASFNELKIQFAQQGSGSISASGIAGEAITKLYSIDSIEVDTNIEFSTSYGLINDSVDDTEDYGLIVNEVTEVDPYGFLYPIITPFGLFNVSGSAGQSFRPVFVGSGSIDNSGVLEEKNTDSYNLGSILPGSEAEDYGTVNTSATESDSYGLITAPVDQAEDYHYVFYTAGETITPFGTIQISGESLNELKIQFTQQGSGTISASGIAGEAITKFYSIDSIEVDTNIEFSTSYGIIADAIDDTEDYGLIVNEVTEVDPYGFLYPIIVPFGLFNVSGSAGNRFSPASYIASGSIDNSGVLEEKNTDSYNINSVLLGGSPEDYGDVNTSATESDSYGLLSAPVDQAEDYHYVFYTAGETITPFGTIQISGASFNELKIQFTQEGSGSISASGIAGEAITKFYSIDSIEVDTNIEFSTSYGLIDDSVDDTEDYGLIISSVTEVDSYGFLYPIIVPFGLFNVSGSAGESFRPVFVGSGFIDNSGVLEEKNTDSYNINSVLLGGSPENYGTVNTSATESDSYGLITAPVDQVENYDYIFYTAGETVYPFGTIQISGSTGDRFVPSSYIGSGTINITGYVLIPQRYQGSGFFSAFGGSAEVSGSNPPDQVVPIVISGAASDLKNTYSNVGSGTFRSFGGSAEVSGSNPPDQVVPIVISGTKVEKRSFIEIGSGRFSSFGGSVEVTGSNPPDQVVPIVISGAASDLKNTYSNVGSGTIVISGDGATEVRGKPEWRGTGTIEISGTAAESFTPATAIGSGTFSAFGGSAEVKGSNPPDQVVPIVISGAASDLKNTYSNVGSGTIVVSGGITPEIQIYVPSFPGSGTAVFSGTAAESFTPATAIGSGTFSAFGGSAEVKGSNPPDQVVPIVISGAASDLKNTYSNVGSGSVIFSGNVVEKSNNSNFGFGIVVFSGTASESFTPATAIGSGTFRSFGGSAEVSGSNPPDQVVPIVISGAASDLKNTYSNVGSGTLFAINGSSEVKGSNPPDQVVPIVISGTKVEKRSFIEIGSGRFSSFGGAAEVEGSNPPDQVVIITLSGNAKERFIPATAVGSGTILESGNGIEKNTESDVGIGTFAITGGITPNVQIYVPYWTGSGTFSAFGGSAEVSGSNPPDRFVLFTLSGTAAESFTPTTAIGSGTINVSGVGVGISNPYRAPYVYVTII